MSTPAPLAKFSALDPLMVGALRSAFDDACSLLVEQPPSEMTRDLLATKILDLAHSGVFDPNRLRDEAVAHLNSKNNRA